MDHAGYDEASPDRSDPAVALTSPGDPSLDNHMSLPCVYQAGIACPQVVEAAIPTPCTE